MKAGSSAHPTGAYTPWKPEKCPHCAYSSTWCVHEKKYYCFVCGKIFTVLAKAGKKGGKE